MTETPTPTWIPAPPLHDRMVKTHHCPVIYNITTAKNDSWIPWAEGGDSLMTSLNEVKSLITIQRKKELPRKLDEAMQRLESMKGKGRSEFYPMVRTYLVFLKKKATV